MHITLVVDRGTSGSAVAAAVAANVAATEAGAADNKLYAASLVGRLLPQFLDPQA